MTEHQDRFEHDNAPHTVIWNGSTARVFDDGPREGSYEVYDSDEFAAPIHGATVSVTEVSTDNGVTLQTLEAEISLDDTVMPLQKLAANFNRAFDLHPNENGLIIERTSDGGVFKVEHTASDLSYMVRMDSDSGFIQLTNGDLEADEDGRAVIRPARVVKEQLAPDLAVEGFLQVFMRTMDCASGLNSSAHNKHLVRDIANARLRTDYELRPGESINYEYDVARLGDVATSTEVAIIPSSVPEQDYAENELKLDDIGGLHDTVQRLKDIALSFSHPEIMEKWGASRPLGVMLFGLPGTGKTMLVNAFANEIDAEVTEIQSSDIYGKWLGQSEQKIKEIFSEARRTTGVPLVLFFDEFDAIIGVPASGTDQNVNRTENAVAGIFKQEMNTLSEENPNIIVFATTNNIDLIDPALMRSGRFDHVIEVPAPDVAAREEIIINIIVDHIKNKQIKPDFIAFDMAAINHHQLAVHAQDLTGADIKEILRRIPLKKALEEARTGAATPICQQEILDEITAFITEKDTHSK